MGAINYGSNNILCSIGYRLDRYDFVEEEKKYFMEEEGLEEEEANERANDSYDLTVEDDYYTVKHKLEKYRFNFYEVKLESGYYEGFYISINDKYNYLDNYKEKLDMQKELTTLRNFLKEIIEECGCRVCYPWWCTSWEESIEDSLKELADCVKTERSRIKNLKTDFIVWNRLSKEERKELIGW